jgi:hypothetical protein
MEVQHYADFHHHPTPPLTCQYTSAPRPKPQPRLPGQPASARGGQRAAGSARRVRRKTARAQQASAERERGPTQHAAAARGLVAHTRIRVGARRHSRLTSHPSAEVATYPFLASLFFFVRWIISLRYLGARSGEGERSSDSRSTASASMRLAPEAQGTARISRL